MAHILKHHYIKTNKWSICSFFSWNYEIYRICKETELARFSAMDRDRWSDSDQHFHSHTHSEQEGFECFSTMGGYTEKLGFECFITVDRNRGNKTWVVPKSIARYRTHARRVFVVELRIGGEPPPHCNPIQTCSPDVKQKKSIKITRDCMFRLKGKDSLYICIYVSILHILKLRAFSQFDA